MMRNNDGLANRGRAPRGILLAVVALLAAGAVTVSGATPAAAHGNPEVKIEPNPATFGGEVMIEGEGFEEDAEISLVLEGVLGEVSLGSVTTDAEGLFSLTVELPSSAAPGSYRVRAAGADDVAIADVRILEAEGGTAPAAEHEAGVGFHGVDSAAEIAGFAVLAGAMVLIALLILWFPGKARHA